jgi:hypothetical protein
MPSIIPTASHSPTSWKSCQCNSKLAETRAAPYFDGMENDAASAEPGARPVRTVGRVADPANPGARLKEIVIVWSAGKDGDPPTWEDNAGSWNR